MRSIAALLALIFAVGVPANCVPAGCSEEKSSDKTGRAVDELEADAEQIAELLQAKASLDWNPELVPETYTVEIVRESELPPERLADALAAKGLLDGNAELLRKAAQLATGDPMYWYRVARLRAWKSEGQAFDDRARRLLERSLAIDSDYLPALYSYAISKPTHELQMQALARIATLDRDNAKPYYLMAIEEFQAISEDRGMAAESDGMAYDFSDPEWDRVLSLVSKGNERPAFLATMARVPSVRDIELKAEGETFSAKRHMFVLQDAVEASSDIESAPLAIIFGTWARALARQAYWQAKRAFKSGKTDAALDSLGAVRQFAAKYACSQPRRAVSFLTAKAVRRIVTLQELDILQQTGDADRIQAFERESEAWENAQAQVKKMIDDQLAARAKEPMPQDTRVAEESTMEKILTEAGLLQ